jgi:hypothetical protein
MALWLSSKSFTTLFYGIVKGRGHTWTRERKKTHWGSPMLNSKMFEEFIFSIHKGFDLRWARHANVLGLIETHLNGQWHAF